MSFSRPLRSGLTLGVLMFHETLKSDGAVRFIDEIHFVVDRMLLYQLMVEHKIAKGGDKAKANILKTLRVYGFKCLAGHYTHVQGLFRRGRMDLAEQIRRIIPSSPKTVPIKLAQAPVPAVHYGAFTLQAGPAPAPIVFHVEVETPAWNDMVATSNEEMDHYVQPAPQMPSPQASPSELMMVIRDLQRQVSALQRKKVFADERGVIANQHNEDGYGSDMAEEECQPNETDSTSQPSEDFVVSLFV